MDLDDVNKVANRKRINAEAEKLRDKVSREAAKIIKLKVAQDTAYWDLKEKLQQVESNHEKLQQNMVEVQMQHEAISGQYQEELRLRPDTLNKVSSTREMCGVLQEYGARLRDTLARCTADQAALGDAYQLSGQVVRELRARHAADAERARAQLAALQEKVQLLTEHREQLGQLFSSAKQQADGQISELRGELAAATARREELLAAQSELTRKLDQCTLEIGQKEQINASLHAEMQNTMQEMKSQATETAAALARRENEIKELKEENLSLKVAVENLDQFTKSICEQKNTLQEQIAVMEEEQLALMKTNEELRVKSEESCSINLNLQKNIENLNEEKQSFLQQLQDNVQIINNLEEAIKNVQAEHTNLVSEKADVLDQLNAALEQAKNNAAEVVKLTTLKQELETAVSELEAAFKAHRDASDEKNKEQTALIVAKDHELDSKASTINQLMSQLKTSSEIRSKLEGALQKIKKEIEIERDSVNEKEKTMANTIGRLESVVRNKEEELSKQMSMMLELRNEKERLQEKIRKMQNTIDNIQKELSRPPAPPAPRLQPEQDDNAVMLTPSRQTQLLPPPTPPRPRPQFAAPRAQDPDSMLYSLFSDSSMEGECLDMAEVNRRFEALARGERLSPAPLSALRRQRAAAPGGLRPKTQPAKQASDNDTQMASSQVKNELKNKERTFFKNKRLENKPKRAKLN